jgi:hypothetical protein
MLSLRDPDYELWQRCPDIVTDITARMGIAPDNRGNMVGARPKAGQPGRRRIPILLGLMIALALPAGLASASVAPGLTPDDGVVGNSPYCDRDYEQLAGDQYIAYNDDLGDYTCLQTTDQQHATGFRQGYSGGKKVM